MRKYFFIFLFLFIITNTLCAADLNELWERFMDLATNIEDDGFLVITENDIEQENDVIKKLVHSMDTDSNKEVTLKEYLGYYGIPAFIARYIYEVYDYYIDEIVDNISSIYRYTGSWNETMAVLEINNQFYSPSDASVIRKGLRQMPRYFRNCFFTYLKDLFPSNITSYEFEKRYNALVDFIRTLDKKNQVNSGTSSLLLYDLAKISSVSSIAFSKVLHLYDCLNTCHYYVQGSGESQLITAIKQILSKYDTLKNSLAEAAKENTITNTLNFVFDFIFFFTDNSPGRNPERKAVSSDWNTIIPFLSTIDDHDKKAVMDEFEILLYDTQVYFLIREDLGLYLESYFPLQYKTDILLSRIISFYIIIHNIYEDMVVRATGDCFIKYPDFVNKNEDETILHSILLCYGKTGSNFYKGYRYMIKNATDPAFSLDKIIWVYESLDRYGLQTLINSNLPLGRIPDIINAYRDSISFYLPLFAGIYEVREDKAKALDVINNSVFFHTQLSTPELENYKKLWEDDFPRDFYFLLETSLSYKQVFSSIDASGKKALMELFTLAYKYSVKFYNMLLFNLDIHGNDAFSLPHVQFFIGLYRYSGDDVDTNIIFSEYYINILKDLILHHNVASYSTTAYLLMDICKANTYSRSEITGIIIKSTPFLAHKDNLENIRQISIDYDYSPDIFINLDSLGLTLDAGTTGITRAFLQDNTCKDNIKEEIFTYGLVMTNNLFPVKPLFSEETLHYLHDFLSLLQENKRRTTLDFMDKITFLKENINSPADMLEFAPLMQELEKIETDLYDEFLLYIIPAFNYLVDTSADLLTLMSELEKVNKHLTTLDSSLESRNSRALYFKKVLIHLTQWIPSIESIREVTDITLSPLDKWEVPGYNYLSYLRFFLVPILKGKDDQDISAFFNAVITLLDVCENQDVSLTYLKNIRGSFFAKNNLASLVDYLKEAKNRTVSLEGGMKKYLEPLTFDEYFDVRGFVNNSLKKSWFPVICLNGDIFYQTFDAALLVGGTVGITLPLSNTRYKHLGCSLFIDTQLLYNIEHSIYELNGIFGIQFPVFWTGIGHSADMSIFIKLGLGASYMNSLNLPELDYNPVLCNAGLTINFDILQRIRIGLRGQYQALFIEYPLHRWGGGLELTYLP